MELDVKMKNENSLISANQFDSTEKLERYFVEADSLKIARGHPLQGKIIASLFYEPSTRTRFSFEVACMKLGGQVVSSENAGVSSSATKGESIEDTVRVISNYADAIVVRHPESGICKKAGAVSTVPIINAGDGVNEHPTQALLDAYSINNKFGKIDGLKIALVGDLLYGRTVHSLVYLLSLYPKIELYLISPKNLKMPMAFTNILKERNIVFSESNDLQKILSKVDVAYMTRIQKERFDSDMEYKKYRDSYCLDKSLLHLLKKSAIIMHPLPRVNEISEDVDNDQRAYYFEQAKNGLYMRMAILKMALTEK